MRRSAPVAVAIALGLALTGCGGGDEGNDGADGQEMTTVVIGTQPTADHLAIYLAMEEGFFEDRGITVEPVPLQGAGPVVTALSNGSVHVADQSPFVLGGANQKGADLRYFCGLIPEHWTAIVTKRGSDFPTAEEVGFKESVRAWKGKRMGVTALSGANQFWVEDMLVAAGLSADDVEFSAVGYGESAYTALEAGQVDLLFDFPFARQSAESSGRTQEVLDIGQFAPKETGQQMIGGLMAPKEWLDANPDVAQGFCDAVTEGIEFQADPANREVVAAGITKHFGISDEKTLESILSDDGPLTQMSTEINCDNLDLALDAGTAHGVLATTPRQTCDNTKWQR